MKRCPAMFSAALAAVLLSACASHAPIPVAEIERHPRSIAIIPVLDPEEASIDRKSMWYLLYGGLGMIVERVDMVQKRCVFIERFKETIKRIGPELTEAMHGRRPRGIRVSADATDADLVVHVCVKEIGLYSKTFEHDYVPQLDLVVVVARHRSGATLVDDDFSYGVNANRMAFWAVPASDKYRFANFSDVLDHADLVDEGWHVGARALAQRIVEHLGAPSRH